MNRMWDSIIKPIIKSIKADYIIEIGSGTGVNTENILEYCMDNDACMNAIDPFPQFDIEKFKAKYGDKFEIYKELSLSRLPLLNDYDVILIDGDHNWYTVYNELKIIEKTFKNKKFPVVFLHDLSWPYSRRDLYYNPENIPEAYRQPYKKLGMYPGQTDLKEQGGLNYFLYNSIYENNPKNGVLTAVEDFIDESNLEFSFEVVNVFHGLGILFPKNNEIKNIVKNVIKHANLLDNLEKERVKLTIENSESNESNYSLKNELNRLEEESKNILATLNESENNNKSLEGQLKELEIEKSKIETAFKESNESNYSLKNELNRLEEESKNILATLNESENNNKSLEGQLKELEIEKSKIETAFKESNESNEILENQLKELKIHLEKLKNENYESKEHNSLLQDKLYHDKTKLEKIKIQLKQTENKLKLSNNLIQEKKNLISQMEKREKKTINKLNLQINVLTAGFLELEYSNNKNRPFVQRFISKFPRLYILFKNKTNIKKSLSDIKGYNAIKRDSLFDIGYYLKNNGDIRLSGVDPLLHYIYHGFKEGRNPNPTFNSNYYLKTYVDVKNSGLNPLIHYALYGSKEGRETNKPVLKTKKEIKRIEKEEIIDKRQDYTSLDSDYDLVANSGFFDVEWYLKNNPDVSNTNIDPLTHFLKYGAVENRNPHPLFSVSSYLKENPDVASADINPLLHYVKCGIKEGRSIYSDLEKFILELTKSNLDNKIQKRILYVIHEGGGGTPHTNEDTINHVKNELDCFILTSNTKEVKLYGYLYNEIKKIYSWSIKSKWSAKEFYNSEFRDIYFNVLVELKIDVVHIQHLVKHTFDLPEVASSLKIPIIISFHDFYYICPSYHLLDDNTDYCAGQCTPEQEQCKVPIEELKDIPQLKEFVNRWRNEAFKILSKANNLIAPSEVVKQLYVSVYPELSEKEFIVIEHGRDFKPVIGQFYEIPSKNEPVKILIPGNINIAKGGELIRKIKEQDKNSRLEFHFIGALQTILKLEDYGVYHGPYKREDFNDLVKKIKPSFIGILSVCPETYCHTLSEAWSCGVPVLTTKLGAQEERVNKNGGGWFIDHKDPSKAYNEIIRIANSPKEYKQITEQVKKITFKNTEEMAEEYLDLYYGYLTEYKFPYLKKSLKGKNGYLFLINDSNNEIRQHFDQLYNSNFNLENFFRYFNLKKKYCIDKNIKYFFFIIPDKSLICNDFLPFDTPIIKRNYNLISNLVPDFVTDLDHTCYFKNDSHINYLGGKELVSCYLNYIDNNFTKEDFNKLINEQISTTSLSYNGDLTLEQNCSYSDEEKKDYLNEEIVIYKNENLVDLKENLPEDFKKVGIRETEYYTNPYSITDLKVLILRDSSTIQLKDVLSVYFREMILHWDHRLFNKELVKWYKPDIILEIRTERFLELMDDHV